jgi:hypothetical protein
MKKNSPKWATSKKAADHSGLSKTQLLSILEDWLILTKLRPTKSGKSILLVDLESLDVWTATGLLKVGSQPKTGKEAS